MRKSPLGPHHTLFLRKKKKIKKSFISSRGRRRGELQFVVRIPSVRPSLAGFPLRSYKEKENTHIIPFQPRFPIMSVFFSFFFFSLFCFPVQVQLIPHFVRLIKSCVWVLLFVKNCNQCALYVHSCPRYILSYNQGWMDGMSNGKKISKSNSSERHRHEIFCSRRNSLLR